MIPSLLNTSYDLYRSPIHFLLTSPVSFYLVTDCTPTLSIDSPVHLKKEIPILFNLPDCVTPRFLYHLDLPAVALIPLNTETRECSALFASQQACKPVNLLDGHAASQSSYCCVKTLIKNFHPEQHSSQTSLPPHLVFFFSHRSSCVLNLFLSFASLSSFHPFPAELKDRSDKKHY